MSKDEKLQEILVEFAKQIAKRSLKIFIHGEGDPSSDEADRILDELLKKSGYVGKNMDERLGQVNSAQLSNINDAWSAHKIKQRVLKEEDFHINKQEAELIINIYKKSFQEFDLID